MKSRCLIASSISITACENEGAQAVLTNRVIKKTKRCIIRREGFSVETVLINTCVLVPQSDTEKMQKFHKEIRHSSGHYDAKTQRMNAWLLYIVMLFLCASVAFQSTRYLHQMCGDEPLIVSIP